MDAVRDMVSLSPPIPPCNLIHDNENNEGSSGSTLHLGRVARFIFVTSTLSELTFRV